MSASSDRYDRSSAAGTMLMLACGMVAAAGLACVYALLTRYNPLLFFTILGTCAFGAGIGRAVRYGAKQGKVRNGLFTIIVGAVLGAVGLYLGWAGSLWLFLRDTWPFDPPALFVLLQEVVTNGPWERPPSLMRFDQSPPAIWAVEAAIVLFLAAATAGSRDILFCGSGDRWSGKV